MTLQNLFVYFKITSRPIIVKLQPHSFDKLFDFSSKVSITRDSSGQKPIKIEKVKVL